MMTKSNLISQPLAYVLGTVPTSLNADQKKAIAAMIETIKKAHKKGGRMKKKKRMSDEDFAELRSSLEQALQHARGERHDLRTTVLPAPPKPMKKHEIVKLRTTKKR